MEGYQQLGPVLNNYSIDLCIEPLNRFETFFLNTMADAVALCDELAVAFGSAFSGIRFTPTSRRKAWERR